MQAPLLLLRLSSDKGTNPVASRTEVTEAMEGWRGDIACQSTGILQTATMVRRLHEVTTMSHTPIDSLQNDIGACPDSAEAASTR
mmetsp:Transcript_23410/g.43331  ORF Transcript_23410/g.43331 Transcript_23410/m.43331 type:complete len:85 (-) Transcript_23410:463-717(-)